MVKALVIVSLIAIVMLAGFVFIYFFYEKPTQEESVPRYYNITIRTFDRDTDKQISTGVLVTLDQGTAVYYNGTTRKDSYLFVQIPENRTFTVFNYNLEKQNNYVNYVYNPEINKDLLTIDLVVSNITNITASHYLTLGVDNPIFLKLNGNGTFNNIHLCFTWSPKIIKVYLNNTESEDIPQRLKNKVNSCFYTKRSIDHNELIIPINYQKFGFIDETDYIKVYILDSDILFNERDSLTTPKFEDSQGNDIGGQDILYLIKNI